MKTVTTKDDALRLALEALETCGETEWHSDADFGLVQVYDDEKVSTAIREALAQPQQEPVAYLDEGLGAFYWPKQYKKDVGFTPLYTAPPRREWVQCSCGEPETLGVVHRTDGPCYWPEQRREWVGLTDDEVMDLAEFGKIGFITDLARAIEALCKERNA